MKIFLGYLITYVWIFFVLGLTIVMKKKGVAEEATRKIVHVSVGFTWIAMALCFGPTFHLIIPPVTFVVLNYVSYKKNIFSGMEREGEANTLGTVYYAVSLAVMSVITVIRPDFIYFYGIGTFCMALGDGLAPIIGKTKKCNFPIIKGKRSFLGSLSVFVISLIVCIVFKAIFALPIGPVAIIVTALAAAVLEIVGLKGIDNLTLPIGTSVIAWLFFFISAVAA
ncbi:MAG: hypothetical protein IJP23_05560 [Oscillospiraceae bacterium]|nr:hypothetical protein [Oscillospiraceae bacterium]